MCKWESMREVSREGLSESLSGGSFLGLIRVLILVSVNIWGVHVRLMDRGMIFTIVQGHYYWRAHASGVYFCIVS
jgi:hypothetical protein